MQWVRGYRNSQQREYSISPLGRSETHDVSSLAFNPLLHGEEAVSPSVSTKQKTEQCGRQLQEAVQCQRYQTKPHFKKPMGVQKNISNPTHSQMRCIVIRRDAWLVLLSPCNTQPKHRQTMQVNTHMHGRHVYRDAPHGMHAPGHQESSHQVAAHTRRHTRRKRA